MIGLQPYNPKDWFWVVVGKDSRAWSSATEAYVQKWPSDRVSRISSEAELADVLAPYGLRGPLIQARDVIAERERRLSLGFDYDFGDKRGIHRIGTTESDLKGWDEVSKAAQAAINLGAPQTAINLVTDTGPVTLTALEWQMILAAAAAHRQPLWAGSFALQAMNPIPADFAKDDYWL